MFNSSSNHSLAGFDSHQPGQPVRDLERIRNFLSSLGPTALLDMLFMPLFLAGCFLLRPSLGWLAVAGGLTIIALALVTDIVAKRHSHQRS